MDPQWLIFPCLIIALYFEAFVLVTFLSTPARNARARLAGINTPAVAIIVPCYNEATTVGATAESLLALDYPKEKLRIVLVNDGSTDGTHDAMERFRDNPQVRIIHKENGGKHTAINAGIEAASGAELIGCLDADSFVAKDALREIVGSFDDARVAASTAAMSVHAPSNALEHMQNAEYILGIALRHVMASINGLYVTPGPFSLYRMSIIKELGDFRHAHHAEDMEMALRIQRAGYRIENAPRARVFTKAPSTVPALVKQRTRWTTGFLRNVLNEYRDLVGNPKYGALGLIVLPLGIFAIITGLTLFGVAVYQLIAKSWNFISVSNGVPLSYVFQLRPMDWLNIPLTSVTALTALILAWIATLTIIGKSVSKTEGKIVLGLIGHAFLYGFIAPFWLMRAVADVATGHRRSWK